MQNSLMLTQGSLRLTCYTGPLTQFSKTGRLTVNPVKSFTTSVGFWDIINGVESCLVSAHVHSSAPWWGLIIGTTVVLRCALTVPLAIHQQKAGAKIELLKPVIAEYSEAIKHNVVVKCRRENQPVEEANRRIKKEVHSTYIHTFM